MVFCHQGFITAVIMVKIGAIINIVDIVSSLLEIDIKLNPKFIFNLNPTSQVCVCGDSKLRGDPRDDLLLPPSHVRPLRRRHPRLHLLLHARLPGRAHARCGGDDLDLDLLHIVLNCG